MPKTFAASSTMPHEVNWAQACKGEAKASSPFDYAAELTEDDAARHRRAARGPGKEDPLRRREHEGHERSGGESVPNAGVSGGMDNLEAGKIGTGNWELGTGEWELQLVAGRSCWSLVES